MVVLNFTFVCKMILEAVLSCGFELTDLGTLRLDKEHKFTVSSKGKNLFEAKVSFSLVSDVPANIYITAQDITATQMIAIANKINSLYGNKVKIVLH